MAVYTTSFGGTRPARVTLRFRFGFGELANLFLHQPSRCSSNSCLRPNSAADRPLARHAAKTRRASSALHRRPRTSRITSAALSWLFDAIVPSLQRMPLDGGAGRGADQRTDTLMS